jgi:hypothetical protein
MKTNIFLTAIHNRNKLKFLYDLQETFIEPYYLSIDKTGKKVIYGKVKHSNEVKKFNYEKISNIRILNKFRFSPVIPIISRVS